MLYSTTIIITEDNKFKGVVINNTTSNIIHETKAYDKKFDAISDVNEYITNNSEDVANINSSTSLPAKKKQIPTVVTTYRRCCGG
jgi:hypothetical protein